MASRLHSQIRRHIRSKPTPRPTLKQRSVIRKLYRNGYSPSSINKILKYRNAQRRYGSKKLTRKSILREFKKLDKNKLQHKERITKFRIQKHMYGRKPSEKARMYGYVLQHRLETDAAKIDALLAGIRHEGS